MKLFVHQEVLKFMQAHAEQCYPNECCGFFYGQAGEIRQVTTAQKVENAKEGDQRRRFQISTEDYQQAEKYALDNDLDLLGVYHSHPDHPAIASEHDRKVAMPWFSYIIVSVQDGEVKKTQSWQLNEERQFVEESIEIDNINQEVNS